MCQAYEAERAIDTSILTGIIGSQAYGIATDNSDIDFMSIVIPDEISLLGLREWGSSGTKEETYKNTNGTLIEHKKFELKKAVSMCLSFNPNIIPLLWLDEYEHITPSGRILIDNRTIFNSKKIYHTFSGFARGQLQKMGGVFNDAEEQNKLLKNGHIRFQKYTDEEITWQRNLRDRLRPLNTIRAHESYDEGYLNALIALRAHSKEECKRIKNGPITGRMGAKRKEIREKFGFDVKFAAHTIRLMTMCVEFLSKPEEGLKVNRTNIDANFLRSILSGAITQSEIKTLADELFHKAKLAVEKSSLPDEPNTKLAQEFTKDLIWDALRQTDSFRGK